MVTKAAKPILLLAVAAVLFALVCPLAPTPTAAGGVSRPAHAVVFLLTDTASVAVAAPLEQRDRAIATVPGIAVNLTALTAVLNC